MNLNPGDIKRGHYQIIQELGSGGFGQTYLAKDLHQPSQPLYVVKQLQPLIKSQKVLDNAKRRFDEEAKTLEILGIHDQIPRLLAYFDENQEFYLVQELIDGQDLEKELKQRVWLNEDDVIGLLEDVLKVLMYVHGKNVIHRDIKPSNLIRRKHDGKICLIDFGAVKEILTSSINEEGHQLTDPIGTSAYISPEQNEGNPNFNSDIYSLGVTAIEALIGKIPQKNIQTDESSWERISQVAPKLKDILNKMVRKESSDRYQSALEVYSELQSLKNHDVIVHKSISNIGDPPISQEVLKSSTPRVRPFPRLFLLMGVGVILGALLIILIPRIFEAKGDQSFNEANDLLNSGEYEKAVEVFERVIKLNPNDYQALIGQGNAYIKLHKYPESLNACKKAIQIKQDEAQAWNCKALALQNLQDYTEAEAAHDRAIQLDTKSADFWNNRGDTRLKSKKYDPAIADFDNAILFDDKSNKNNSSVYVYNRGKALSESGRHSEAIASFDSAITLNPNNHYAWTGRGNALRLSGKYEESVVAYERAIQIASKEYESWYGKCLSLEKSDQKQQAIESCNQAIQIDPKNSAAIDAKERLEKN